MEQLIFSVLALVLLFVAAGPVGTAVAFFKTRKRLNEADRRLERLESELRRLRSTGAPAAEPAAELVVDAPSAKPTPSRDQPPVAEPPVAEPPVAEPPVAEPSVAGLPVTEAAPPEAPGFEPPATQPPAGPPMGTAAQEEIGEATPVEELAPQLEPADTAPPADRPPFSPPRPKIKIDWEQWVGVRGAAVLGGVVLALAGILFLKYSIERDLIPPVVRVAMGVATGIAALIGSERLRKKGYETVSNSLAGASVVLFYASVWAARALYQLIPDFVAWGFMVLVTVVCGLLAWRRNSLLVAVLGLAGGFVTPFLLASGQNRPIGLFAYILLLDVGLIVLARKRRWPVLGVLSLAGTTLYQLLWVGLRMESGQLTLALAILAVFAVVYALAWRGDEPTEGKGIWRLTQAAGVLLPFLFAFYFAMRSHSDSGFGDHLAPVAGLLLVLSILALSLSRALDQPVLARAAAAADVAVFAVWSVRVAFDDKLAWEASAIAAALALAFQLFQHFKLRRHDLATAADEWAPLIATAGLFVVLLLAHGGSSTSLWPWLAGWVALAALLVWSGGRELTSRAQVLAAAGLSFGFFLFLSRHAGGPRFPSMGLFFGLALASAVAFQVLALVRRKEASGRHAELAAATSALILLVGFILQVESPGVSPALFFGATLGLGGLLAMSSMRLPSGKLLLATMAVVATGHLIWQKEAFSGAPGGALLGLAGCAAGALFFTAWPFLAGRTLGRDRWALYSAALAAPAWFFSLGGLWESRFGTAAIGALPVLLGLVSLAAAVTARGRWPVADPQHKRSLVWFLAVALGFVSVAIPLQLDKEWITIGWALEGFALLALWRRLDHAGLKYFGLALLAATSVRLVGNPEVLDYHPRARFPIVNWLMYTYLVPAAALLGSARILERLEVERRLPWEKIYSSKRAWGATLCAVAAILTVFVWINLTIFDFFSTGSGIELNLGRHMARDLTLSLAWAVFALGLLAIGMVRKSSGLRWMSLCFLILTIGKAFLYDLGELEDLYRVASLAGLAISLIVVSLAYQRFVFGAHRDAPPS